MTGLAVPRMRRPTSVWLVDAATLGFALWTLCCHAMVALGGSLAAALGLFAVAAPLLGWVWRRQAGDGAGEPATPTPTAVAQRHTLRAALALLGLGLVGIAGDSLTLWTGAVVLLGVGALATVGESRIAARPVAGAGRELGLLALGVACAALTALSHRVDTDDAFYLNLAAAAADAPWEPLLAGDTLHGIPGLPLHLAVYAVHSYEMAHAALSWLTGLPVIASFHGVAAVLGALAVPLAFARLLRWLLPRQWLLATGVVVVVLFAIGDLHRWHGNFGFVRLWQGKSLFVTLWWPVIAAAALEFARRPSRRGFALLAAAEIAALGSTSSAIWAGPAVALASAAAAIAPTRQGVARLGLVLLASAYVLGVGWQLKGAVLAESRGCEVEVAETAAPAPPTGVRLDEALTPVIGHGRLRIAAWIAMLLAWATLPVGLGARFALVVPLAVLAVPLDPYLAEWMRANVVGTSYWRALWALSLPLWLALLLMAPAASGRPGGVAVTLAALAAFVAFVPEKPLLGRANRVALEWPRWKVPVAEYAAAQTVQERLPAGTPVLAPHRVAHWLVTFRGRVQPLVVRDAYLDRYVCQLGQEDVALRQRLARTVAGQVPPDAGFAAGLEGYGVRAVVVPAIPATRAVRTRLTRLGFGPVEEIGGYGLWLRAGP